MWKNLLLLKKRKYYRRVKRLVSWGDSIRSMLEPGGRFLVTKLKV